MILGLLVIFSGLAFSQSTEQAADSKQQVAWFTQIDSAKAIASASHRPILMVFSGSDWCKPCILLRRELFESKAFETYAKGHLVLLELDFPARSKNKLSEEQVKHNEALAEKFNPDGGFPLVLVINTDDTILGTFGYEKNRTPEDYIQQLNGFLNEN
jgi:thioredoxin-related protein